MSALGQAVADGSNNHSQVMHNSIEFLCQLIKQEGVDVVDVTCVKAVALGLMWREGLSELMDPHAKHMSLLPQRHLFK